MYKIVTLFFVASLLTAIDTRAESGTGSAVEQACRKIGNKLGSVGFEECMARHLQDSKARSFMGVPLLTKEYPPIGDRIPKGRVLLLGGIHGDEYSSVSVVFKWLATLDRYHSGLFHWLTAPLVNPDGLLRKDSQRINANGVDLNRNFLPLGGYDKSLEFWHNRANLDPRRYPGPNPLSEPEALWVTYLIHNFKPDVIVSVHAPYGIVDFDGEPRPPSRLGPLHLNLLGTYPGSLGNYAALQLGIPVITIELPYAGIMPSDQEIRRIWIDLVRWLKNNLPPNTQTVQLKQDPE